MAASDDIAAGFTRLAQEVKAVRGEVAAIPAGDPGVSDIVFAAGTTAEDIPPGTPANTLVVLI